MRITVADNGAAYKAICMMHESAKRSFDVVLIHAGDARDDVLVHGPEIGAALAAVRVLRALFKRCGVRNTVAIEL